MGDLQITRSVTSNAASPEVTDAFARIQRRLKSGTRGVGPVVEHFAREFGKSIDTDFRVGGRPPFVWQANARNTIAAKGHGRPLIGAHGNKLQKAIRITVDQSQAPRDYKVDVNVPMIGELHQLGAKGPWIIRPKPGGVLRFVVAEAHGEFLQRRKRAVGRRRAGQSARVPARPGKVVIFTKKEIRHPGFPARKFVVVREGLIREAWRKPLRAYLFDGVMPS